MLAENIKEEETIYIFKYASQTYLNIDVRPNDIASKYPSKFSEPESYNNSGINF